ncbi:protein HEATR9 [Perognathus longimembris pacificus]|uniref:protein HEATR9 n=1 Tax=Perognathus longimembris pacificus TaxID=214514 RepID=UPI002018DD95|nr:protein HEATR9 [Perognathus longimembris pacificus]
MSGFEVFKSMFMYPWLEYQDRAKEFRKAMAPVHLPLSCYQMPREEYPPSPEHWRKHPRRSNAIPYCFCDVPEVLTYWHTLVDKQKERETLKVLQKNKDQPRCALPASILLTPSCLQGKKGRARKGSLDPTKDLLKWKRLKELTQTLTSPREEEQLYAAQALRRLGINDKFVMEALWQVAQTGPEKVKSEAYRTLAILGCLNKYVIQAVIDQLKNPNMCQKMETLRGLRVALNSWAAVPKDKRIQVENEKELVCMLKVLIKKPLSETTLEAALCLGFLRPHSNTAQEFLVKYLCQGPKSHQMKALKMLIKIMQVHSVEVTRAILDQITSSVVIEDRYEAIKMLKTIGLEQIKQQGLQELTFNLLKMKTHNEPFLAIRKAVAELVEELKMKPMMMNMLEAELMNPNAVKRQEAVISLGVLGVRGPQVFHLLLDMLDVERNQAVKKSLQETLLLWASMNPWIQSKLRNKVFFVSAISETSKVKEPTRFRKEPDKLEELNIQDFRLAKLNPLFISQFCNKEGKRKKLPAFPPCFSKPQKQRSQTKGPWQSITRKQIQDHKW